MPLENKRTFNESLFSFPCFFNGFVVYTKKNQEIIIPGSVVGKNFNPFLMV
jgi:hypothetical protein